MARNSKVSDLLAEAADISRKYPGARPIPPEVMTGYLDRKAAVFAELAAEDPADTERADIARKAAETAAEYRRRRNSR